jgi:hypothetical protein
MSRSNGTKNWFDADDDVEMLKSVQSSDSSLTAVEKEKKYVRELERLPAATAEVSAGDEVLHSWGNGVVVTRQVIVETSQR